MSVGGDTLAGVAQLAAGLSTGAGVDRRPLSLDLLWQVGGLRYSAVLRQLCCQPGSDVGSLVCLPLHLGATPALAQPPAAASSSSDSSHILTPPCVPAADGLAPQVLERGQEISRRTWSVLRVAVVELRGATFVGRVFFGDAASGQVAWACDCRPSDACWLALKVNRPASKQAGGWRGPEGAEGAQRCAMAEHAPCVGVWVKVTDLLASVACRAASDQFKFHHHKPFLNAPLPSPPMPGSPAVLPPPARHRRPRPPFTSTSKCGRTAP